MKYLIVYAHPNPNSFNSAELQTLGSALKQGGHDVRVRDLYAEKFNPVLGPSDFQALASGSFPADIAAEQSHIRWADVLVFLYPVWWAGMPAMMKGYVDRVFLKGFAYDYGRDGSIVPLLSGKKAAVFSTTGTPSEFYEKSGMHKSMRQTADEGIFAFCGVEVLRHDFFGGIPSSTAEQRAAMLKRLSAGLA